MRKITHVFLTLFIAFSVLMCSSDRAAEPQENRLPVLENISIIPTEMGPGGTAILTASATDMDGDNLEYTWECTFGTFSDITPGIVRWKAPEAIGEYTVVCTVTDGQSTDERSLSIPVTQVDVFGTVTDIDGNVYKTVKIGDDWWMAENLKTTRYNNGDSILNIASSELWDSLSNGAFTVYNNDQQYAEPYGLLYNWLAVRDNRNIAPEGWHTASDSDWKTLEMYLGMNVADADSAKWRGAGVGGKLKEAGTGHWRSPNAGATDYLGFRALPGGDRFAFGRYHSLRLSGYYWTSTGVNETLIYAWYRGLSADSDMILRGYRHKNYGLSIRCVKDRH